MSSERLVDPNLLPVATSDGKLAVILGEISALEDRGEDGVLVVLRDGTQLGPAGDSSDHAKLTEVWTKYLQGYGKQDAEDQAMQEEVAACKSEINALQSQVELLTAEVEFERDYTATIRKRYLRAVELTKAYQNQLGK